ncbi:transcriptional regulator [Paenibacillus polymyxa]|uniref:helix-turn-helix domain-containing protein n=1 Tax=Paenibacillus polymyxa TaxID=1406 RepID=UPI0008BEE0D2|nr:transcriptional regulator [Paenibacillus polymyxa]MBE3650453.1 transcriptional regulator [Paenibacillus polymyxa]MDN4077141.1 transcriptional regulator [Paenibacillus polymyxa]MDN4102567.1 transcriptional regulator [Paenibacillus polymyxa]MDN4112783.1 transcriptional regulator [Paenibacillus polymyxa]UNL96225.1 transcriptional regulator [Paenibacillus polymyxa]
MEDKEVLKLVGARIQALRKEKGLSQESLGEKNVSLINITKIADALDVSLIQLFAYVNEDIKVTKHEEGIQEIVNILQKSSPEKVRLARNVIREITN